MRFNTSPASAVLLVLSAFALQACGPATEPPVPQANAGAEDLGGEAQNAALLNALVDDIWADLVATNTNLRLRFGLPIDEIRDQTLEEYHRTRERNAAYRARLAEIDPALLDGQDRISHGILEFEYRDAHATDDDFWLQFDITPNQAPYFVDIALRALAAQTVGDGPEATHFLMLVGELGDLFDQMTNKVEGQVGRGLYVSRHALPAVRETWAGLRNTIGESVRPADDRVTGLSDDERAEFDAALDSLIETRLVASLDALLDSVGEGYEKQAPEAVGLAQYPHGAEVYARLIEAETTLNLPPAEINEIGRTAVADISARMAAIREQLGFEGTGVEFVRRIQADPRFIATSPADLESRYLGYIAEVEAKLDDYFMIRPEAPYGVKRLPLAAEPGMTYGYYSRPTAGEPVGYYVYNASNLEKRSLVWARSLIYHELLPGHHFHIARQAENRSLSDFRRQYSVPAFTEGWAEYAASLGLEMGLYADPYEQYGRYLAENFFAVRLVVDTGMNAFGMSLDEAHRYMAEHTVLSDSEIESELLRYSTSIPAQALAYRLGYDKFRELRKAGEVAAGPAFDVLDFHELVLKDGAVPLSVLDAKVRRALAERASR